MISGYVSDDSDGQAIELVNVALLLDGELITGGVTNQDGIYVLWYGPRLISSKNRVFIQINETNIMG